MSEGIFARGTRLQLQGDHTKEFEVHSLLDASDFTALYKSSDLRNEPTVCKIAMNGHSLGREASNQKKIGNHPNIVALRAFGRAATTDGKWNGELLAMEDGGFSLQSHVAHGEGITIGTGMKVVAGVEAALTMMHNEVELVHGDVTPGNILLGARAVKLCDFEFARPPTSPVIPGPKGQGTKYFVAPEQLKGHYSAQSDVFGLAASVHAGLAGRPPIPRLLISGPRPLKNQVSDFLWDERYEHVEPVLLRGFNSRKNLRPASAAEFAAEMREAYEQGNTQKQQREQRTIL